METSTVADLQERQRENAAAEGSISEPDPDSYDDAPVEDDEPATPAAGPEAAMRAAQAEVDAEQRDARRKQLQLPVGGPDPDRALLQIAIPGAFKEIAADKACEKGTELTITLTGYVKGVKFDDRREGGDIVGSDRIHYFVAEEIEVERS